MNTSAFRPKLHFASALPVFCAFRACGCHGFHGVDPPICPAPSAAFARIRGARPQVGARRGDQRRGSAAGGGDAPWDIGLQSQLEHPRPSDALGTRTFLEGAEIALCGLVERETTSESFFKGPASLTHNQTCQKNRQTSA